MKAIIEKTGKSESEIKAFYLAAIDTLMNFGMTEKEARTTAREALKETILN